MSEATVESASPKDDVPSQQQPEADVKMEDASGDEVAKEIKLEEELFATDSEDDEFPGKRGPDTPPSSDEDKNSQPTSSYAFSPQTSDFTSQLPDTLFCALGKESMPLTVKAQKPGRRGPGGE